MPRKLMSNIGFMFSGNVFRIFTSLVSIAVYIRFVGVNGYASIGIVWSFFEMLNMFDMPFMLAFIKNCRPLGRQVCYDNATALIYVTNLALAVLLIPILVLLSVYHGIQYLPYYLINMLAFLTQRLVNSKQDYLRANGQEDKVQKALVVRLVLTLAVAVILLVQGKSIVSIFLASLVGVLVQQVMLSKMVPNKATISLEKMHSDIKSFVYPNYVSSVLLHVYGATGVFICSFFLDAPQLGVLTIIVSANHKLRMLTDPIYTHLGPWISNMVKNKLYPKMADSLTDIHRFLLILFILLSFSMLLFMKYPWTLLYGKEMAAYYYHFTALLIASFFMVIFTPDSALLFAQKIGTYNRLNAVCAGIFIMLILILSGAGLKGILIAYIILYLLRSILLYHYGSVLNGIEKNYSTYVLTFLLVVVSYLLLPRLYIGFYPGITIFMLGSVLGLGLIYKSYSQKFIRLANS